MNSLPLSRIATINMGQAPAGEFYNEDGLGLPLIAGAGDFGDVTPAPSRFTSEAPKKSERGDIILCVRATIGDLNLSDRSYCLGRGVAGIRAKPGVADPRYVWWALDHNKAELSSRGRGATFKQVNRADIEALEIPCPPLEEQRRIASILDQANTLRRARQHALTLSAALKAEIFESMFRRNEDSPLTLQVKQLGDVVRAGTIVTYGMVQAGSEFEGGVPYIRTGDIIDGEIAAGQLRRADPAIAARFDRARVDAGDIVMSIRATVGTTAMVPKGLAGANLTQGTAKIAPGELTDPIYLLEYLRSKRAQVWIAKQVKGATFREITLGRLREMPVELPSMDLQKTFSARIAKLAASQCAQREQARQFDTLFASLRHRAFAGDL